MSHENPIETFRARRETYDREYRGIVRNKTPVPWQRSTMERN